MKIFNQIHILIYLFTFNRSTEAGRYKRRVGEWTTKSIGCYTNPKYATDEICRLYPVGRNIGLLSFGCTFLESHNNMSLQIVQYQKMNSNRYMPGYVNIKEDMCEFVANLYNDKPNLMKTVLVNLMPTFKEVFKDIAHPCPYKGKTYVYNITLPKSSSGPIVSFLPVADFKQDHSFLAANGDIIFTLTLYSSTK